MFQRYGFLGGVFLLTLFIQGCGSGSSYSDFNPKDVSFEEIQMEVAQKDLAQKAKLEKAIIEKGAFEAVTKQDVIQYQLYDAIKQRITHQKEMYQSVQDAYSEIIGKELKNFTAAKVTSVETKVNGVLTDAGSNKLFVEGSDDYIYAFDTKNLKQTASKRLWKLNGFVLYKDKIFASDYRKKLTVYERDTLEKLRTHPLKESIYHLAISGNKLLSTGYSKLTIRGANSEKVLTRYNRHSIDRVSANKDYFTFVSDDKTIHFINMKNTKKTITLKNNHDAKIIDILIHQGKIITSYKDRIIEIYDIATDKYVAKFKTGIRNYHLSASGNYVVFQRGAKRLSGIDLTLLKEFDVGETNESIRNYLLKGDELFVLTKQELSKFDFTKLQEGFKESLKQFLRKESLALNRVKLRENIATLKELLNAYSPKAFLKVAGLTMKKNFKNGTIGERYVPYTSTSYSSPKHTTTYINGRAYNQTKYEDKSYSSGGYDEKVYGYKAIYRIDNTSKNYYYVKLKQAWSGKYSKYKVYNKGGAWSNESGKESKLVSDTKRSTHKEEFVLAPGDNFKFQFEVGEDKPSSITLEELEIYIIPKSYYEALNYALDVKNEDLELLNKFLIDEKLVNWDSKIVSVKEDITKAINERFNKESIKNAEVRISFDEKTYDKDFKSKVTLTATSTQPMCVYVKTPFGNKVLNTYDGKESGALFWKEHEVSKNYTIEGYSKDRLKATVEKVAKICE